MSATVTPDGQFSQRLQLVHAHRRPSSSSRPPLRELPGRDVLIGTRDRQKTRWRSASFCGQRYCFGSRDRLTAIDPGGFSFGVPENTAISNASLGVVEDRVPAASFDFHRCIFEPASCHRPPSTAAAAATASCFGCFPPSSFRFSTEPAFGLG